MSIKNVEYSKRVFKPLEKIENVQPGEAYTIFSEDELRNIIENLRWPKASEKSFQFWNNPEDAVYDTL